MIRLLCSSMFGTALCFASVFGLLTVQAFAQGPTWTSNTIQAYNGYDYELWNQNNAGSVSMTLTGDNGSGANARGGTFTATWSGTENILFRSGRKWSTNNGTTGLTAAQHGNISVDFDATWSSSDNVKMLGIYGWAHYAPGSVPTRDENGTSRSYSNQIEYYIISDRGSWNPASGGTNARRYPNANTTVTIDGISYQFWVADRIGQPALTGNSVNFKQYFSVPANTSSHRTSGIISVSRHFEEWVRAGMIMNGPLYEVAMKVESYTGASRNSQGSTTVRKNLLTIGGTPPSSSSTGGGGTSSAGGSSSSSSNTSTQATNCNNFIGTLPASPNPPANPYTACFRHTNNNCYVCRVQNEGGGNTCASTWLWNGNNVDDNLALGYWYQAVTCPASSSSSVAPSSSSRPSSSSIAPSSSSRPSSSSVTPSSSSRPSSSSIAPSSSSRPSSSSVTSSSSSGPSSSSSAGTPSSSSAESTFIFVNQENPKIGVIEVQTIYYNLQGQALGTAKPKEPGVYIVKNIKTKQIQMVVVK
ncbi:MAG: glycoside hydrolase family 11 protein [Fibromonadaceae bacterium]|nr:glycoside hydrolase family 11 protein [Fibromonadaceae bacterium]